MPYLKRQERRLYYTKNHRHHKASVVLIHGAAGTHLDWPPQLRRLEGVDVYSLDLPGHGRSEGPPSPSINLLANEILTFKKTLNLEDMVLIGHSMGGAIALTVGMIQPPEVSGLILISTGARLRVMDDILQGVTIDFETTVDLLLDYLWANSAGAEMKALGRKMLLDNNPTVVRQDYLACNSFDVLGQLNQVAVPTLIICGTADQMTPLKYSQYLAEQIPNARLAIIEGAGHMLPLERPDYVASLISEFLQQLGILNRSVN